MTRNNYNTPIKYTETGLYGCGPKNSDDVYTVSEFKEFVADGMFRDYDGHGHPAIDHMANGRIIIKPSKVKQIPPEATHIVWYNK